MHCGFPDITGIVSIFDTQSHWIPFTECKVHIQKGSALWIQKIKPKTPKLYLLLCRTLVFLSGKLYVSEVSPILFRQAFCWRCLSKSRLYIRYMALLLLI